MDLDGVAAELYALPPAEFIAERDARAAAARAEGDDVLGAAIKKLRRPTVSASLLNALVQECGDDVARLMEIGEEFRAAQASGAGDELRQLMRTRQEAIRGLLDAAGRVAAARGATLSQSVAREIQESLLAAVSDLDAEAVLRCGRLTEAISLDRLPTASATPASSDGAATNGTTRTKRDELGLRRAWQQAREAALEARREAERAAATLSSAEAVAADLDDRLAELHDEIARLTSDKAEAAKQVAAARKARTSADRAAKTAADRASRAEAATKA